jgi:putative endonuclease
VVYEVFWDSYNAISRVRQIKAASRHRKIQLIESMNPEWRELLEDLSVQEPDCHARCARSQ